MYAIFARHVRHLPQTCAPSLPDTEPIPTAHKKSDGPPPGDPSLDVLEAGLEPMFLKENKRIYMNTNA